MTIRPGTAADVEAVAALEQSLFGVDAWSRSSVEEELAGERRTALVSVVAEAGVVGYAVMTAAGEVVDLQRIAVHPAHRRTGIAAALLRELLATAGGADRMLLEVSAANDAARAFYRRCGFVEIDRRRRYYRDGTDALVLALKLDQPIDQPIDPPIDAEGSVAS